MTSTSQSAEQRGRRATPLRRAVLAAGIGNAVEWYDYSIYGYLAVTIGIVFFPSDSPVVSLLSALAVFGLAFVVRPAGAFFFGSLGDKIGRQRTLVGLILLISGATFTVGLLPGYASIGLAAPAILIFLRLVQGFSAGGEVGSASTFLGEYAPPQRRGLLLSLQNVSSWIGILAASVLVTALTAGLSEEAMVEWGWRIPFLIAGPLGLIGLYLRRKVEDTPEFRALRESDEVSSAPMRDVFRHERRSVALCFGLAAVQSLGFYMILIYGPTYLSGQIGTTAAFVCSTIALLVAIVVVPLSGALSDRIGRRPIMFATCIAYVVLSYPCFLLMSTGSIGAALLGQVLLAICVGAYAGGPFAAMVEMFSTTVRCSGFSVGYNLAVALFGGTAPFAAAFLIEATGNDVAPAYYLILGALVSLVTAFIARETAQERLRSSAARSADTADTADAHAAPADPAPEARHDH